MTISQPTFRTQDHDFLIQQRYSRRLSFLHQSQAIVIPRLLLWGQKVWYRHFFSVHFQQDSPEHPGFLRQRNIALQLQKSVRRDCKGRPGHILSFVFDYPLTGFYGQWFFCDDERSVQEIMRTNEFGTPTLFIQNIIRLPPPFIFQGR